MKNLIVYLFGLLALVACRKKEINDDKTPIPPITVSSGLLSSSPGFPVANKSVTITLDVSQGNKELLGLDEIYIHTGVITDKSTSSTDWKYMVNNNFTIVHSPSRMTPLGNNKFSLTFIPNDFYHIPEGEKILKLAMVFRNANGTKVARNADGSDIYVSIFEDGKLNVNFTNPVFEPLFEPKPVIQIQNIGQELTVTGVSSAKANLSLLLNGESFAQVSNATSISGKVTIKVSGKQEITIKASNETENIEKSFSFIIGGEVEIADLPVKAKKNGITIINGGKSVIYTLYAPNKKYIHLLGDFNNWQVDNAYALKRTTDGKTWWIQVDDFLPNTEYAYQFLVEGDLRIADPYSELVLDPNNDSAIPFTTYSSLKAYPSGKTTGIVSAFNTSPQQYSWQQTNFVKPAKEKLVIYELHLRDFIKSANYTTLIDTLNHLANLGVNAIELMPVNEFEGNSSWGYNPSFYLAPDKYYGTKSDLKKLIDECHKRGIAVILDMVLNHSFGQSPMVQLYFDKQTNKVSNSPWFNTEPTHPYNVGYDFNHESEATKSFVKNVLKFWIEEYHVDGFRFDLSKGFTQTNYGTLEANVDMWSRYDAGRVAIWKEYNNYIKSLSNDFYVILEHFAYNDEERELEADGMMFWNNMHYNFCEASMGYIVNSDFSKAFYTNHGFSNSGNLITYMESHDEERVMYKNIKYGNSSTNYSIKNINTALKRQEMTAAFLFSIPGAKMLWQFGELGYDISINQNTRTGEKPILWDYKTQPDRKQLYDRFAKFIKMKINNNVFNTRDFSYQLNTAVKQIILKGDDNNVVIVGNFDVEPRLATINFPVPGLWTNYLTKEKINVSQNYKVELQPGEYYIFSEYVMK